MCVVLREEQTIIIRELMKLATETGVCVDLEDGGAGGETLYIGDGWKETTQALDGHLKNTECDVGENKKAREAAAVRLELGEEMVPKETKGKGKGKGRLSTAGLPTVPLQNEKKPQEAPLPPSVVVGKRKRGSGPVDPVVATAGKHVGYIDPAALEMDSDSPPPRPQLRYKPQKEVPNSQSTGEEEADVESAKDPPKRGGFDSYGEHEEEEGTTEEEEEVNTIKSPAQKKKKKAVAIPKKGVSRRVSHPRKVHK